MTNTQNLEEVNNVVPINLEDLKTSEETVNLQRSFLENSLFVLNNADSEIDILEKMRKKIVANDDVELTLSKKVG